MHEHHFGYGKAPPEPTREEDELAHVVIGAAIEVHRQLGPGFLESVYEEALCVELALRGIPFEKQVPIRICYKGQPVGAERLDLLVSGKLIVELKAVDAIIGIHTAQLLSYLRAAKLRLGLLINFNVPLLKQGIHRVILS